jgi:hypothetical protein
MSYYTNFAKRLAPAAEWITGDGAYAVIARCRYITVALYETRREAEFAEAFIGRIGCGGGCRKNHSVVYLGTKPRAATKK